MVQGFRQEVSLNTISALCKRLQIVVHLMILVNNASSLDIPAWLLSIRYGIRGLATRSGIEDSGSSSLGITLLFLSSMHSWRSFSVSGHNTAQASSKSTPVLHCSGKTACVLRGSGDTSAFLNILRGSAAASTPIAAIVRGGPCGVVSTRWQKPPIFERGRGITSASIVLRGSAAASTLIVPTGRDGTCWGVVSTRWQKPPIS